MLTILEIQKKSDLKGESTTPSVGGTAEWRAWQRSGSETTKKQGTNSPTDSKSS